MLGGRTCTRALRMIKGLVTLTLTDGGLTLVWRSAAHLRHRPDGVGWRRSPGGCRLRKERGGWRGSPPGSTDTHRGRPSGTGPAHPDTPPWRSSPRSSGQALLREEGSLCACVQGLQETPAPRILAGLGQAVEGGLAHHPGPSGPPTPPCCLTLHTSALCSAGFLAVF